MSVTAIERMEALGREGFTVSVCFGPTPTGVAWSVQVLSRDGREFARPFKALSFSHAMEIAEIEITKRKWRPEKVLT